MAKKRPQATAKAEPTEIYDVIDEVVLLPEEYKHYVTMQSDDDNELGVGKLRFVLNRDVLDFMKDVVDELEMTRGLPVEARQILITDPVVVHILQNEPLLDAEEAITKAMSWYAREKRQVQTDALFVSLTMYNELNLAPKPYEDGEVAFSMEAASERSGRGEPRWLRQKTVVQIPPPERKLLNTYELRLKQLLDISNQAGTRFTAQFWGVFNAALAKTIRVADNRDSDGFQPGTTDSKISEIPVADDTDS